MTHEDLADLLDEAAVELQGPDPAAHWPLRARLRKAAVSLHTCPKAGIPETDTSPQGGDLGPLCDHLFRNGYGIFLKLGDAFAEKATTYRLRRPDGTLWLVCDDCLDKAVDRKTEALGDFPTDDPCNRPTTLPEGGNLHSVPLEAPGKRYPEPVSDLELAMAYLQDRVEKLERKVEGL